ncbi:hypothetical protein [uncultured Roseibium sp.]|uniref:hypothetical protein n=1 Tax=uncultured Roseibium sp. TaxID=1936171 RepID=UPI0026024BC3|nr:hypothetical protein [uncultured Roseibium sp.]
MANRDDVLSDFIVEEEISPEVLGTYLQRYPEYTKDLLALFNELTMSELEATDASLPFETKAMTAEALRVQHVRQSLFGRGVKDLARELGLPRTFFLGLNTNVVHLGSVPVEFLKNLAAKLDVRLQDLINGMQQGDGQAVAMKSDNKPGAEAPIEFQDYVGQADLAEEEQRALRKLLAGDGSN